MRYKSYNLFNNNNNPIRCKNERKRMMEIMKMSKNSINMPLVGFGTYQLTVEQAEQCVVDAIEAGYRHIDSAEGYGNEVGTGRGIKASGIDRNELFITTKLFPGYKQWGMEEKGYVETIATLKNQLEQLQLDYVDLYLIHAPIAERRLEQWHAMVEFKGLGLAKHIGVSNYGIEQLEEIKSAGLQMPEVNQVEFHPICAREDLTIYIRENHIEPVAYSSLAPLSSWRAAEGQGGEVLSEIKGECQKVLSEIANNIGVTEAQLLLRYGLQKGYVVLTKSSNKERINSNIDLFDFEIPLDAMALLDDINQNQAIAWAASGINPMLAVPNLK